MNLSLRELLTLVTVVAVSIPALLYSGPLLSGCLVCLVAAVTIAAVIRAFIERDGPQAAAIGFAITAVSYSMLVMSAVSYDGGRARWLELDPYRGSLPTTVALQPVMEWAWSQRSYKIDPQGRETTEDVPPGATVVASSLPGGSGIPGSWTLVELPNRDDFMTAAHALWTLLFGYVGSKYASHVYRTRVRRGGRLETQRSGSPSES